MFKTTALVSVALFAVACTNNSASDAQSGTQRSLRGDVKTCQLNNDTSLSYSLDSNGQIGKFVNLTENGSTMTYDLLSDGAGGAKIFGLFAKMMQTTLQIEISGDYKKVEVMIWADGKLDDRTEYACNAK